MFVDAHDLLRSLLRVFVDDFIAWVLALSPKRTVLLASVRFCWKLTS